MGEDDKEQFLARLKAFEGRRVGEPALASDPVNVPMVRHWCEAMGDSNPVYTDPGAADASIFGGPVAPPSMLQVWTMRGLKPARTDGPNAQAELWEVLAEKGFTSVVAVNCDQEYRRYLRPGDRLEHEIVIDSISPEKETGLGTGHFINQLYTFRVQDGEVVGTMTFRLFKFRPRPKKKQAEKAASGERPPRPRPSMTRDTEHFWKGLDEGKILVQRCIPCGELRHPPEPMCAHCNALEWDTIEARGDGTIYSFVVMHHPALPAFDNPNPVALIELDEGVRLVSNVVGLPKEEVKIGMRVRAEFVRTHPDVTLHQFRPMED